MTTVLTDLPGPKARVRHGIYGAAGTVVILALIAFVIYKMAVTGQFDEVGWSWLEYTKIQQDIVSALLETLQAFAVGAVLALAFGALLATGRLSDHAVLRLPSGFIVELFRAIPLLVLMYAGYFGLTDAGLEIAPFWAVVVSLMLYNGSVLAEVFRAGMLAVPHGQSEAAYAIGMRKSQVMTVVLLPQALRAMLPTIVSQLVVLLKDTALGSLILFQELLYYFRNSIGSQAAFGRPVVPAAISVAVLYIVMCLLLSWLATFLERRNRRSRKHIDLEPEEAQHIKDLTGTSRAL